MNGSTPDRARNNRAGDRTFRPGETTAGSSGTRRGGPPSIRTLSVDPVTWLIWTF
jgi:hypothetical protein